MSDTEPTKTGARMNLSHLRRVRKERRKIKGRGVPLDSSLLMGDPSHDPSHWGESEIQANDRILGDEIVELQASDTTEKVYSGVAKGISRLDQPE